jgi:hypothetical protein
MSNKYGHPNPHVINEHLKRDYCSNETKDRKVTILCIEIVLEYYFTHLSAASNLATND